MIDSSKLFSLPGGRSALLFVESQVIKSNVTIPRIDLIVKFYNCLFIFKMNNYKAVSSHFSDKLQNQICQIKLSWKELLHCHLIAPFL